MKQKWKRQVKRKTQTRTGGALARALAIASGEQRVKPVGSVLNQVIKKVIKGTAETKMAMFYQSTNSGSGAGRSTGTFTDRGWCTHNGNIATASSATGNNVDLHQLIPNVVQGNSDNQRIGESITPTSLIVNGAVRISLPTIVSYTPVNMKVVMYVLQHVALKDYTNLYASNDFSQLLETGENTTTLFNGQSWQAKLPVAKQYYRLLKKKIITLRYAGGVSGTGNPPTNISVANSHSWFAEFTLNLSKHVPAKLKYPENNVTGTTLNEPTNSSIFMCFGYYLEDEPSAGGTFLTNALLETTYVSRITWKDL